MLTSDPTNRKNIPLATGLIDYFPDALAEVARVSKIGNSQHMPGQPLHWDRSKSTDESDALMRHFVDRDKLDTDGSYHAAKVAWRALAYLQKLIESRMNEKTDTPTPMQPVFGPDKDSPTNVPNFVTRPILTNGSVEVWGEISGEADCFRRDVQSGSVHGSQQELPFRDTITNRKPQDGVNYNSQGK